MKIGFAGLGQMGSAIAGNLLKAGHTLTVYNRTRTRADALQSAGARIADTPGGVASGAEVVFTMLADDYAVDAVVFSPGTILDSLPEGAIHVSMSTISVALSQKLAEAHRRKGQHFVSAPVFGRPEAAAAAKLFVVAAGESAAIQKCRELFDVIGQRTFEIGEDQPAANLFKISGNFLITTVLESLAESFALVRKSGYDHNAFLRVMTESLFTAPVYKTYGEIIASEKFDPPGFKLPLGLKDNRLVLAAAEEKHVPMPIATLIGNNFLTALAQGLGESDWSAIATVSFQNAGLKKQSRVPD
jgi:3-hydroxyisobutyrate dehydrogenase-like beta-hydroxyacid dehydrogenase